MNVFFESLWYGRESAGHFFIEKGNAEEDEFLQRRY
jgi:hypothetical protein